MPDIVLRPGDAAPATIVLRALPVAPAPFATIVLAAGEAQPTTIRLRPPGVVFGGVPTLTISPAGIASLEAFGTPVIGLTIAPAAIAPAEAFGTPTLTALSNGFGPQPLFFNARRLATMRGARAVDPSRRAGANP